MDTKPAATVEEALAVTRDVLVGIRRSYPPEYLKAKETAEALWGWTNMRLGEVADTLSKEVGQVNKDFRFTLPYPGKVPKNVISSLAYRFGYAPNTNEYHEACIVDLEKGSLKSVVVVSFHSVGEAFKGLLVAVAYFQSGDGPAIPLSDDVFRIIYSEPAAQIEKRFRKWLDQCIIRGLAEWRRTLI
jgi:hypothetical protein